MHTRSVLAVRTPLPLPESERLADRRERPWIAATALAHGVPLVTRNERHFSRVPELEVIGYAWGRTAIARILKLDAAGLLTLAA